MARWGFDLDGTLDHEEIRALANFLHDHGEEVHVLTGNLDPGPKLARLGVRCSRVHVCSEPTMAEVGYAKAQILNRLGIKFMVDDDPTFVKQIAYYSDARILMVVR